MFSDVCGVPVDHFRAGQAAGYDSQSAASACVVPGGFLYTDVPRNKAGNYRVSRTAPQLARGNVRDIQFAGEILARRRIGIAQFGYRLTDIPQDNKEAGL
jgi:hypothetical protein